MGTIFAFAFNFLRPGIGFYAPKFAVLSVSLIAAVLFWDVPRLNAQPFEDYRIGVQDKLQIKIGRWMAAENTFENWEGLGGEHIVSPDGKVYVAIVGGVPARGKTPSEVSSEISLLLQSKLGLDQPPIATVEVLEFRPIFVVGDVNSAGSYPFSPEMTVLQAIGLAGGHVRSTSPTLRTERETLNVVGEMEELQLLKWSQTVRIARLHAELNGSPDLVVPSDLSDQPVAAELIALEKDILKVRRKSIASRKSAIEDLKRVLETRIEKLDQEIELRKSQYKIINEELANVTILRERGLVASARQTALSGRAIELEATILSLEVAKLTAEQQLNEAVRDELELVDDLAEQLIAQLRELIEELQNTEVKLLTARKLYRETESFGRLTLGTATATTFSYRISRLVDGVREDFQVDESDAIMPGDTLRVIANAIEINDGTGLFPQLPN